MRPFISASCAAVLLNTLLCIIALELPPLAVAAATATTIDTPEYGGGGGSSSGERGGVDAVSLHDMLTKLRNGGKLLKGGIPFDILPLSVGVDITEKMWQDGDESALVVLYAPQVFPHFHYEQLLPLLAELSATVHRLRNEAAKRRGIGNISGDATVDESNDNYATDNVRAPAQKDDGVLLNTHGFRVLVVDASEAGDELQQLWEKNLTTHKGRASLESSPNDGVAPHPLFLVDEEVDSNTNDDDDDDEGDVAVPAFSKTKVELLQLLLSPKGPRRRSYRVHPSVLERLRSNAETEENNAPATLQLLRELPPVLLFPAAEAPMFLPQTLLRCGSAVECGPITPTARAVLQHQQRCGCIELSTLVQPLLQFVLDELRQTTVMELNARRRTAELRIQRRWWKRVKVPNGVRCGGYSKDDEADDELFNAPVGYAELKGKTDDEVDRMYLGPMKDRLRVLYRLRDMPVLQEARKDAALVARVRQKLSDMPKPGGAGPTMSPGDNIFDAEQARERENYMLVVEYLGANSRVALELLDKDPCQHPLRHLEERIRKIALVLSSIRIEEGRGTAADQRDVRLHAMTREHKRRRAQAERFLRNMKEERRRREEEEQQQQRLRARDQEEERSRADL